MRGLYGAVPLAHFFLMARIEPGALVIDATCGNGQDTVLLAELAGDTGRVLAFDLQEAALERTRGKLADAGLEKRVELILAGHERLAEFLPEPVKAVVFNLGYLPAGEKQVRTLAETTVSALDQAQKLLLPSGLIVVSVYTGHDGGEEEWAAVKGWCEALSPLEFNVWQSRQLNRSVKAPFLVMVEKMPQGSL